MRFVDEYRDPTAARALVAQITALAGDDHFTFMEVCGGHTHTIYRHGIEHVLPPSVELVHGPGCPVCVIPMGRVDDAIALAREPGVIFTSFGDMMRVPGSNGSLLQAKAEGADVRFVYSPLDALKLAQENPDRRVLFFAVGFETTAPSTALTLLAAKAKGITNFSVFSNHVTIVPPLKAILESPDLRLDGFLGPGHVSTVVGQRPYRFVPGEYGLPLVTAGFEPLDILHAIFMLLAQIREGRCAVENQYSRVVREEGNPRALAVLAEVFELRPHFEWRGLGFISQSGLKLRPAFAAFDAELLYEIPGVRVADPKACQCGEVLKGVIKPWECKVFGTACTPETPIGTCMVSSEGACAAYYNFGRMHREARGDPRTAEHAAGMTTVTSPVVRRRIRVVGVVQGVGFRPFVYRLAIDLGLSGWVGNDNDGVFVEVEGDEPTVGLFAARLHSEAPPLARIFGLASSSLGLRHEAGFRIVESRTTGAPRTYVAPDIAVCPECVAEMLDPTDRRWRYPFINCTNCGPRFTITRRLPYDRPHTTMDEFVMCDACATEYHDPGDRRFHAQPVACATCGPHVWFDSPDGVIVGTDHAISATQRALARDAIVAIKGLGGYHLACDASSSDALTLLRARKQRVAKPLAVMVRDMEVAHSLAWITPQEEELLCSPERPIVLLAKRPGTDLAEEVAPGNRTVGLLLPYTPLHHLLFHPVPGYEAPRQRMLVMTSGNLTDEPICYEDADARTRLENIADVWLIHDRPIHVPCDDSVVRMGDDGVLPIRRSRGYAPLPVRLPFEVAPVLAMGGELKNTFCLASGREAWVSQHIGDMGSLETLRAFERSTRQFGDIYAVDPECIVADAHPGYQTRRWAEAQDACDVSLVQHHHAHIAAVMVEHGVPEGDHVIGFAFDGTGYGTDGAIWGGEVLIAGYDGFERPLHLRYVPLPGGDATVRKPYRAALAHLWAAGIGWWPDLPPVQRATRMEREAVHSQLERSAHCIPSSSMGRLFDAVSSLLGVRHEASYEAQAALELEWAAGDDVDAARPYCFAVVGGEIDPAPVLRALIDDMRAGYGVGPMAAGFHFAVADLIAQVAGDLRARTGIQRVALSGGVFQNVLVLRRASATLSENGFEILTHRLVPPNDGGLALGQAALGGRAAARSRA